MISLESEQHSVRDPVFVICLARSGSTLLRFLLDAHPELACPPETNVPTLCSHLATVWSLIEGAPLSVNRNDEPPEIPDAAIAGIRRTLDEMIGSYLARKGKRRYCDKSLGTARYADLLLRVFPEARFICLYRHPMDVIASGMEACPWGLNGYGFDAYIAETPGNAVLALARYWADNTASILAVEERYPDRCHRVRYEDLAADPEHAIESVFSFLQESPAPGVSAACFSGERERFGPGDHKIWWTSQITSESVGRGWSVPAGMINPGIKAAMNEIAGQLGYLPADDSWGTTAPPADLRADASAVGATSAPAAAARPGSGKLGEQLRRGLAAASPGMAEKWGKHASETFVAVEVDGRAVKTAEYWLVDLKTWTVSPVSQEAQEKSDWDIIGDADAWERVIRRDLNLNVALRSCQLRYCDETHAGPQVSEARIGILASMLGLAVW